MKKVQYMLLHNQSNLLPMKTLKLACLLMGTLTVTLSLTETGLKILFGSQASNLYGVTMMISLSW